MGWAAIGKAVGGAVTGGAKKVAADKLLNRKKKTGARRAKAQEAMGGEQKGGALAVIPKTPLVPVGPSIGSVGDASSAGDTGGKEDSPGAIVLVVNKKMVKVESLLKTSIAIKKDQRQDTRKQAELDENKEEEAALEKAKPTGAAKGIKISMPGKGLIAKVVQFISTVFLGYWAVRLIDWLPKIAKWAPVLGRWVDRGIDILEGVVDALSTAIMWGYKFVEMAEGWIGNTFGEEGAEKFRTFMGNLKDLIAGFLVWKIIGEKIVKGVIASVRNVWKTVTTFIRKAWVRMRRLVGRHVRKFFGNLAKRAGGIVRGAGRGLLNLGKAGLSKVGGLLGRGGGALAKTGVGKVAGKVGGWAAKIFGKAAGVIAPALKAAAPAVKGFAGRIPILGPIIVAIVSLMSGEPVGQALFKGVGAALGGALGTFIPIPVVGTLLGEAIGAFVGDLLYYLIIKRDPKKAFEVLKQTLMGIFTAGKAVVDWIGTGFQNYIKNFLIDTAIDIPKGGGRWTALTWLSKAFGMFDFLKGVGYVTDGQVSKFPNLLQLYNPFKMAPLLIRSFFGGGERQSVPSGAGSSDKEGSKSKKQKLKELKELKKEGDKGWEEIKGGAVDKETVVDEEGKTALVPLSRGGWISRLTPALLHKGEIVIDPDSAGPAKDMLLAINEASTYDGIVDAIRTFAPYEALAANTVTIPDPGVSPGGVSADSSKPVTVLPVPMAAHGVDPYESLDFYG